MLPNSYSSPHLSPRGKKPLNPSVSFGVTVKCFCKVAWEETTERLGSMPELLQAQLSATPPGSPSPLHFDLISYFQLQEFPHVCKTSWPVSPPALGETLNLKMKIRGPFAPGEIRHKQAWGEPLGQSCFSRLVTVTHSRMPPALATPTAPAHLEGWPGHQQGHMSSG